MAADVRQLPTSAGDHTAGDGTPGTLRAAVLGAVLSPGVYPLADGARVRNLIEAAGGAQANADLSRLDVTASLRDLLAGAKWDAGALRWSSWRRCHQATTWRCHYRRRLALQPP